VIDDPSIHVLLAGDAGAQNERPILAAARGLDRDERVLGLDRYGVRTFGFRVTSRSLAMPSGELTDLDVQRALLTEVESGRIQHVDPNVVYVVVLDASMQPVLGGSRDWLSYHSLFHPTELPMRYVVVRGGLDPETLRDAIRVSVARTLVNPDGDGWY
jgi:hypothetical protein